MLESLGIRRFGSLMGIAGLLSTLGYAAGPVVTGWIHDRTGSYVPALWMFVGVSAVCVAACLACRPLQRELDERADARPSDSILTWDLVTRATGFAQRNA